MTLVQAKRMIKKYEGKLYENYSGRCMFGETTYGVVVDRGNFFEFNNSRTHNNYRTDNLGLDYIIY